MPVYSTQSVLIDYFAFIVFHKTCVLEFYFVKELRYFDRVVKVKRIIIKNASIENIIVAIVINVVVIYVVLKTSARMQRFLGKNGIAIIQRIFGVILLAIAVKLFTSNIQELFN